MELIYPNVELWSPADETMLAYFDHISRCAKVCYASDRTSDSTKFFDNLTKRGHDSMLRHGSWYFKIPVKELSPIDRQRFIHSPYCGFRKFKKHYYVSTNGQYYRDNLAFFQHYGEYQSTAEEFKKFRYTAELIRLTFCVTSQISTTRELNRTSPNNIAEQSTRYVDFGKKGVKICVPHWYDKLNPFMKFLARTAWRAEVCMYKVARKFLQPQDAREFLPLTTASKVVYTYNVIEWRHILDLRYFGKTGKPHPNAKIIGAMIYGQISALDYNFDNEL